MTIMTSRSKLDYIYAYNAFGNKRQSKKVLPPPPPRALPVFLPSTCYSKLTPNPLNPKIN